jgi:NADPH-dependent ferric siderophore reductase
MTVQAPAIPAYRVFAVHVARVTRLSPSFLRICFTGDELAECAPLGLDQRIKVLLPLPGRGMADCPRGADWYAEWRALPEERRNPVRTYTVRAWRRHRNELDVDFVLHGSTGPASAWASRATAGDEVAVVAPNALFAGDPGGYEWRPPPAAARLLLAGDETAVPAVCAIVESLPPGRPVRVLLEVPTSADVLPLPAPAGVEVTWLPRWTPDRAVPTLRGSLLTAAVAQAVRDAGTAGRPSHVPLDDVDLDAGLLWEVPSDDAVPDAGLYAWLAGEAGVVRELRRHLVQEAGLDRRSVAFMGYWRQGRAQ